MNTTVFKLIGLGMALLFIPGAISAEKDGIALLENQLSRIEKEMKDLSAQLARLKGASKVQTDVAGSSPANPASQLEVVKTYLELIPDTQVRDGFFRTVYLVAKVRVQNVGNQPVRDTVVYAACPECSNLGWQPNGDLDKLSGTINYLGPKEKEEIALTIAGRTMGVAQPHDNLDLPREVKVRLHEGGCKETACPVEVSSNRTPVPVSAEGSGILNVGEPFYRKHR